MTVLKIINFKAYLPTIVPSLNFKKKFSKKYQLSAMECDIFSISSRCFLNYLNIMFNSRDMEIFWILILLKHFLSRYAIIKITLKFFLLLLYLIQLFCHNFQILERIIWALLLALFLCKGWYNAWPLGDSLLQSSLRVIKQASQWLISKSHFVIPKMYLPSFLKLNLCCT